MLRIALAAEFDCAESCCISDATTTAKPRPCSPSLAVSMLAFRESRLVCDAIAVIRSVAVLVLATDSFVRLVCSALCKSPKTYKALH